MSTNEGRRGDAEGVYYSHDDLISLPRRILIALIDGAYLAFLWLVVVILAMVQLPNDENFEAYSLLSTFLLIPLVSLVALVVVKRFLRTPGYWLLGAKLVTQAGERPGMGTLLGRLGLLFVFMGPLNLLIELSWSGQDRTRVTLRDRITHCYAVRVDAQPAARGRFLWKRHFLFSWSLLLREVEPAVGASITESADKEDSKHGGSGNRQVRVEQASL